MTVSTGSRQHHKEVLASLSGLPAEEAREILERAVEEAWVPEEVGPETPDAPPLPPEATSSVPDQANLCPPKTQSARGRPVKLLPQEVIDQIVAGKKARKSNKKLAKAHDISEGKVKSILAEKGIMTEGPVVAPIPRAVRHARYIDIARIHLEPAFLIIAVRSHEVTGGLPPMPPPLPWKKENYHSPSIFASPFSADRSRITGLAGRIRSAILAMTTDTGVNDLDRFRSVLADVLSDPANDVYWDAGEKDREDFVAIANGVNGADRCHDCPALPITLPYWMMDRTLAAFGGGYFSTLGLLLNRVGASFANGSGFDAVVSKQETGAALALRAGLALKLDEHLVHMATAGRRGDRLKRGSMLLLAGGQRADKGKSFAPRSLQASADLRSTMLSVSASIPEGEEPLARLDISNAVVCLCRALLDKKLRKHAESALQMQREFLRSSDKDPELTRLCGSLIASKNQWIPSYQELLRCARDLRRRRYAGTRRDALRHEGKCALMLLHVSADVIDFSERSPHVAGTAFEREFKLFENKIISHLESLKGKVMSRMRQKWGAVLGRKAVEEEVENAMAEICLLCSRAPRIGFDFATGRLLSWLAERETLEVAGLDFASAYLRLKHLFPSLTEKLWPVVWANARSLEKAFYNKAGWLLMDRHRSRKNPREDSPRIDERTNKRKMPVEGSQGVEAIVQLLTERIDLPPESVLNADTPTTWWSKMIVAMKGLRKASSLPVLIAEIAAQSKMPPEIIKELLSIRGASKTNSSQHQQNLAARGKVDQYLEEG
jgi:hypothetical protein